MATPPSCNTNTAPLHAATAFQKQPAIPPPQTHHTFCLRLAWKPLERHSLLKPSSQHAPHVPSTVLVPFCCSTLTPATSQHLSFKSIFSPPINTTQHRQAPATWNVKTNHFSTCHQHRHPNTFTIHQALSTPTRPTQYRANFSQITLHTCKPLFSVTRFCATFQPPYVIFFFDELPGKNNTTTQQHLPTAKTACSTLRSSPLSRDISQFGFLVFNPATCVQSSYSPCFLHAFYEGNRDGPYPPHTLLSSCSSHLLIQPM